MVTDSPDIHFNNHGFLLVLTAAFDHDSSKVMCLFAIKKSAAKLQQKRVVLKSSDKLDLDDQQ